MRKRQFTAAATAMAASMMMGPLMAARARARDKPADPPPLLLAMKAPEHIELSRYLVSEKFDGVRAYWDGETLVTRQGQAIALPAAIAAHLPKQALDGELWMGRGRFEAASAAVRRHQALDADWAQLKYMVFELPHAPGSFEQRYAALRALAADSAWPGLQVVQQSRVKDQKQLAELLATTVQEGGEGLMLHEADVPYLSGRSEVLLKLKPQDDDEAVVLAHVPGDGQFTGLLGALLVRNGAGHVFKIGTGFSAAQRHAPPPVGATISYRHRGLTNKGLPRFASYLRQLES